MENTSFNKLLLKTAFSCMACDDDIDNREIELIKEFHQKENAFGTIDFDKELKKLTTEINNKGQQFLKEYFRELNTSDLTEKEELKLVEVAIGTIKADEKVEYSEIKFFKVIKSQLKIDDNSILKAHPDFGEYLEDDIMTESYLSKYLDGYFDIQNLSEFDITSKLKDSIE